MFNTTTSYPVYPQGGDYGVTGLLIDGAVYKLAGQPPVAVSKSWGNMAWFFRRQ